MTPFYRYLLKHICRKLVIQGYTHKKNITEYYRIMDEAIGREFTEDSGFSLQKFQRECLIDAQGGEI